MQVSTDGQRGVDNGDAPLRVRSVDVADAPLRVRSVDVPVALLRVIRDAATSGKAEISESDVPQACAATPSQSRRNDVDEEDGCRDRASETTLNASGRVNRSPRVNPKENPSRSSEPVGWPQRPEQRSEVPEHKRTRHEAKEERSIREYRNSQLVHCPHQDASACSGPVGGTDTGWLAEEVENLAPSIFAPGSGDRQPSDPSRG